MKTDLGVLPANCWEVVFPGGEQSGYLNWAEIWPCAANGPVLYNPLMPQEVMTRSGECYPRRISEPLKLIWMR